MAEGHGERRGTAKLMSSWETVRKRKGGGTTDSKATSPPSPRPTQQCAPLIPQAYPKARQTRVPPYPYLPQHSSLGQGMEAARVPSMDEILKMRHIDTVEYYLGIKMNKMQENGWNHRTLH